LFLESNETHTCTAWAK